MDLSGPLTLLSSLAVANDAHSRCQEGCPAYPSIPCIGPMQPQALGSLKVIEGVMHQAETAAKGSIDTMREVRV